MAIHSLGFIGAGNMAGAIINGLLDSGLAADRLYICDPNAEKREVFAARGCHAFANAEEMVNHVDALVLAVKPQLLKEVCAPLKDAVQTRKPLIISVVAAIPSEAIDSWLGSHLAIVRTMPNTPALVGAGATGLFANELVTDDNKRYVEHLFKSVGSAEWIDDEYAIHAVTAAAGSAPAYFFRFAEAMAKQAEVQGLPATTARKLIGQTMLGAAKMIMETDVEIAQMRQNVCSPNGTTERAIISFNGDDIDAIVARAMQACFDRSVELSNQLAQ